jgi:hypothetical protein
MAKDDSSIPAWQRAASASKSSAATSDTPPAKSSPEELERKKAALEALEAEMRAESKSAAGLDLASAEDAAGHMPSFDFVDKQGSSVAPTREEARKFLEHPGTKGAELEDRIRFLELKGVKKEDIEAILPGAKQYYVEEEDKFQRDLKKEQEEEMAQQQQQAPTTAGSTETPSNTVVPPVITYPEFLVKNNRPPLMTLDNLLNTMYVATGAAAGIYGLSKFVLEPMHKQLSEARHEFFSHSVEKIGDMNGRITKLAPNAKSTTKAADIPDDKSEASVDSDPTELFHRDIGVQTDDTLTHHASSWSLPGSDAVESSTDPITSQQNRLTSLTTKIRDLQESGNISNGREKEVKDQLDTFVTYLNDIMYASPYYSWKNHVPSWSSTNNAATAASQDEFDKFKAEIKSIKGAMLSSRNFPRGG